MAGGGEQREEDRVQRDDEENGNIWGSDLVSYLGKLANKHSGRLGSAAACPPKLFSLKRTPRDTTEESDFSEAKGVSVTRPSLLRPTHKHQLQEMDLLQKAKLRNASEENRFLTLV